MAKHEYGALKQAILAIIKARPGISSTDVRAAYDAQMGKPSPKSSVSAKLTELHSAGDVLREKVLSDACGYYYRYWLTTAPVAAAPAPAVAVVRSGKPEYTKPFYIGHAKAGAPYGCRDGDQATVLKWDGRRPNEPLVGCIGVDDVPASWGIDGRYVPDESAPRPRDLVMLPLGFIDGKPVWVGDELALKLEHANVLGSENTTALPGWYPDWTPEIFTWPAPAPVYPETLLTIKDAEAFCDRHKANIQVVCDPIHHAYAFEDMKPGPLKMTVQVRDGDPFTAIANFALRHAIDAGQVVLPGCEHDAERDMAIALAVQDACVDHCEPIAGRAQLMRVLGSIDLSAIIARVSK